MSRSSLQRCTCRPLAQHARQHGSLSSSSSASKASASSNSPSASTASTSSSSPLSSRSPVSSPFTSKWRAVGKTRWPWDSLRTQHTARSPPSQSDDVTASSNTASSSSPRPMRSLLYVPGSDPKKLKRSLDSTSDVVIFDLEDSVAASEKGRARSAVYDAVEAGISENKTRQAYVRINSNEPLRTDDLEVVLSASGLDGIVIPKVDTADQVAYVDAMIEQHALPEKKDDIRIIASIESPLALMNLREIATSSKRLSALLFAAEDYCASSDIIRTPSRVELAYARSAVVAAAKAYGLKAIDLVCIEYKDADVLSDEASEGRRLGFDGKQAIHPAQVEVIQRAFSPSEKEVERALKILEQYDAAAKTGKGAYGFQEEGGRSTMIDAPMLLQARAVLRAAGVSSRSRKTHDLNAGNGNGSKAGKQP